VSGSTHQRITVSAVVSELREALRPETRGRAQALAARIELNGARIAAERLVSETSGSS
jgi:hypothetical protein